MKDRQTRLLFLCTIASLMVLPASQGVNPVYDPCRPPTTIRTGDGFSFALAFGGMPETWNNTVPCNTTAIQALPAGAFFPCQDSFIRVVHGKRVFPRCEWHCNWPAGCVSCPSFPGVQMAVFRPQVDQLTLIRVNNVSMLKISEAVRLPSHPSSHLPATSLTAAASACAPPPS